MTIRRTFASIVTAAGIVAAASPAIADEMIPLDRYDLTSAEQVDRLHSDIVNSAMRICEKEYRRWTYGSKFRRIENCVKAAVDNAVSQVKNQTLSEMHMTMDVKDRYDPRLGVSTPSSASGL